MGGISIHVVDVSRGLVAAGMKVELYGPERKLVVSGVTNAKGLLEVDSTVPAGAYEAAFHVAAWYRAQGVALPAVPFLDVVHYHFGISDPKQHYHLPFKCTPWGYSCFRGGA
jgi:5-hydroxyisourate hydrolase